MSLPRLLPLLALAAVAAPAAAQPTADELLERCRSGRTQAGRERHCEVRESRLPAGALRLDAGTNGGVTVRAYDGREVVVRAVVLAHAGSAARARGLAGGVRVRTDGTVRAEGPRTAEREGWHVSYDVLVPARTDLDLQARNGPLSVSGVTGTLRLAAENGPVNLDRLGGDVRARVRNGPINVTLEGARWSGAGLDAESVNGPISVRMPRAYAARIEGGTTHGPISTDLPMSGRNDRPWGPRTLRTEVNGGGPTLRFVTVNGPLSIRRS